MDYENKNENEKYYSDKECDSCNVKKDINKGISCNVNNCHYHEGSNYCTADCISVGPSDAQHSADTLCATFKPKSF